MNKQNQPLPNPYLKTISIIHIALTIGQLLFASLAFIKNGSTKFELNLNDTFFIVEVILVTSSVIASNFLFKQNLDKARQQTEVSGKLTRYQSALIIRYALLEGPSLFGIVVYMITGNVFFLAISSALILYFLFLRPTKQMIKDDLQLSYDEAETL